MHELRPGGTVFETDRVKNGRRLERPPDQFVGEHEFPAVRVDCDSRGSDDGIDQPIGRRCMTSALEGGECGDEAERPLTWVTLRRLDFHAPLG